MKRSNNFKHWKPEEIEALLNGGALDLFKASDTPGLRAWSHSKMPARSFDSIRTKLYRLTNTPNV